MVIKFNIFFPSGYLALIKKSLDSGALLLGACESHSLNRWIFRVFGYQNFRSIFQSTEWLKKTSMNIDVIDNKALKQAAQIETHIKIKTKTRGHKALKF